MLLLTELLSSWWMHTTLPDSAEVSLNVSLLFFHLIVKGHVLRFSAAQNVHEHFTLLHFWVSCLSVFFVLSHVITLTNAAGFRALLNSLILRVFLLGSNGSFGLSCLCSYDLTEHHILPKFHNWVMAFKFHVIAQVRLVHSFLKPTILLHNCR